MHVGVPQSGSSACVQFAGQLPLHPFGVQVAVAGMQFPVPSQWHPVPEHPVVPVHPAGVSPFGRFVLVQLAVHVPGLLHVSAVHDLLSLHSASAAHAAVVHVPLQHIPPVHVVLSARFVYAHPFVHVAGRFWQLVGLVHPNIASVGQFSPVLHIPSPQVIEAGRQPPYPLQTQFPPTQPMLSWHSAGSVNPFAIFVYWHPFVHAAVLHICGVHAVESVGQFSPV